MDTLIYGLAWDPKSLILFGVGEGVSVPTSPEGAAPSNLYRIDPLTGGSTLLAPLALAAQPDSEITPVSAGSLQFGPDGELYAGGVGGADWGLLLRVDPYTGLTTPVGPTGFSDISGLTLRSALIFEDGFESGDTCAWEGACDPCSHHPCTPGAALPAECSPPCTVALCSAEEARFCCEGAWSEECVEAANRLCLPELPPDASSPEGGPPPPVPGFCGDMTQCGDPCMPDQPPLAAACDECTALVCDIRPLCCIRAWDSLCVEIADSSCTLPRAGIDVGYCAQQ
jgi:hypothetical protein